MPIEIGDLNSFLEIVSRAVECRVVRGGKNRPSKIKARTKRYLYTYVIREGDLDSVLERVKEVCKNIVEISS
ncbi:MAG: hypothetical protein ABWJ42_01020 [Sulfolobales archaeon]